MKRRTVRSAKQQERDAAKQQTFTRRQATPLKSFSGWTHSDLWLVLQKLVDKRYQSRLTQQDIADRMGVSRQQVSRLEGALSEPSNSSAYREPTLQHVQRYAAAIGYEVRIAVLDAKGLPAGF